MIRELAMSDYEAAAALWQATPGIGVTNADSPEGIAMFLARNPGLSAVCEENGTVLGTALCGHDGRRGYLYHVVVKPQFRGRGIGQSLVRYCLAGLAGQGICRCHVFVFADNALGNAFWQKGWRRRGDIAVYTRDI
jgi:ribosomal protein S18 acetylase RimI-like enzyme